MNCLFAFLAEKSAIYIYCFHGNDVFASIFYWSVVLFRNISFLFIDDFDAFFHYESAESIAFKLNRNRGFQSFVTSHNTYLMQNKVTRPDCCFIMSKNKITSLSNSADKEIMEAHYIDVLFSCELVDGNQIGFETSKHSIESLFARI